MPKPPEYTGGMGRALSSSGGKKMSFAKQAKERWTTLEPWIGKGSAGSRQVYRKEYAPTWREARTTAREMGRIPALYSGYNLALQNLANQMARMGLSQSGIAQASRRALLAQRAEQAQRERLRALAGREQALAQLAALAHQAGMGAWQLTLLPHERASAMDVLRYKASEGRKLAEREMIGQGLGALGELAGTAIGFAVGGPPGAMLGSQLASQFRPTPRPGTTPGGYTTGGAYLPPPY